MAVCRKKAGKTANFSSYVCWKETGSRGRVPVEKGKMKDWHGTEMNTFFDKHSSMCIWIVRETYLWPRVSPTSEEMSTFLVLISIGTAESGSRCSLEEI